MTVIALNPNLLSSSPICNGQPRKVLSVWNEGRSPTSDDTPSLRSAGRQESSPRISPEVNQEDNVILHIYSLGRSQTLNRANKVMKSFGIGVFHASVEIHGIEWSFALGGNGTGILRCSPGVTDDHLHLKAIDLGPTNLSANEVLMMVMSMHSAWQAREYDIINKNCCHFADAFLKRLGKAGAPAWLLRSSSAGAKLQGAMPRMSSAVIKRCFGDVDNL
eukprot:CAMPEP_0206451962 /NCGR_PEP_ID=MMETSP0324_2-20121206/19657_1 /ASSEMBLY_ACC=CAM_ASM_000836 /TAXON_ID=2866 /ORGANISM="Crypthecodinium cohnii, Strain Seligo" /LENGTH=218 /DNA_ID=CAMNT_0053921951 /DNA_START=123 /DNA_END=779 /DNA_ORIENTATION=+